MFNSLLSYLTHFFYNKQLEDGSHAKTRYKNQGDPSTLPASLNVEEFSEVFKETFPAADATSADEPPAAGTPSINVQAFYSRFLPHFLTNEAFLNYVLEQELPLTDALRKVLIAPQKDTASPKPTLSTNASSQDTTIPPPTFSGSDEQIAAALKLLLNGLMKNPQRFTKLILDKFTVHHFLHFLFVNHLQQKKQELLLKTLPYKQHSEAQSLFHYNLEIVWLSYAVLAKIFLPMIASTSLQHHIKLSKVPLNPKFLTVLRANHNLYSSLIFIPQPASAHSSTRPQINDSLNLLNSQSGIDAFESFLNVTRFIFRTNDSSLVELALVTVGQILANADDATLDFLLEREKRLNLRETIMKFIMSNQPSILLPLGRLILTLCLRNVLFIDYLLRMHTEDHSVLNELLYLAIAQEENLQIKVQYMTILFVILLNSKVLTLYLLQPTQTLLSHVHKLLEAGNADLVFVALQLVYAIAQHDETHEILVSFTHGGTLSTASRSTIPNSDSAQILTDLKRLTFSPISLLRYYTMLIWKRLVCSQSQAIVHFLCQQEQLLNTLMFLLREEQEIALKRLCVSVLYEIAIRKNNLDERSLLLHHFNILFELTEIFKDSLRYSRKYVEIHSLATSFPSSFHQHVGLLRDVYFLMVTFCNYDTEPNEHDKVVTHLLERYNMTEYFKGFLFVLRELSQRDINDASGRRKEDYLQLYKSIKTSMGMFKMPTAELDPLYKEVVV